MNGFYDYMLWLIAVGAVFGMMGSLGVFETFKVTTIGNPISETQVTSLQSGIESQTANDFSTWQILSMFLRGIGTWIKAVLLLGFFVGEIMMTIGVPLEIAVIFCTPIQILNWFVIYMGLVEWSTGRNLT